MTPESFDLILNKIEQAITRAESAGRLDELLRIDESRWRKQPTILWTVLVTAIPAPAQGGELEEGETADWTCVVKVAALMRTAKQGPLMSLGAAARAAGVSQIRFDRLLTPWDREDRRGVLVSIAHRAIENGTPFSVVDAGKLFMLQGEQLEEVKARLVADFDGCESGSRC
jgi:hypothetical protein